MRPSKDKEALREDIEVLLDFADEMSRHLVHKNFVALGKTFEKYSEELTRICYEYGYGDVVVRLKQASWEKIISSALKKLSFSSLKRLSPWKKGP